MQLFYNIFFEFFPVISDSHRKEFKTPAKVLNFGQKDSGWAE